VNNILLDSNLIIYAGKRSDSIVMAFLRQPKVWFASEISIVECLGYRKLDQEQEQAISDVFNSIRLLPVNRAIIERATKLRQSKSF
jgi:predicted nucleic acid-binding protein